MITSLHHINLTVPPSTLPHAHTFYATTLGLHPLPVPAAQRDTLAWYAIGTSGQQVHISSASTLDLSADPSAALSSRHPCFRVESEEALGRLRGRVWEHFVRGGEGAPREADKPGEVDSGAKGVEYPTRFFARDYAGNRLEFSL